MGENANFTNSMQELNKLAVGGLKNDEFQNEIKSAEDILRKLSKDKSLNGNQIKDIIKYLDKNASIVNTEAIFQLGYLKNNFKNLLDKHNLDKKEISKVIDDKKSNLKKEIKNSSKTKKHPKHKKAVEKKYSNEYNYSTADKLELSGSLEDIVFNEVSSGSSSTIENAMKNLKDLKVDIYNVSSYLRVRDQNLKQIINHLDESSEVRYTGNYKEIKYNNKNRIFIEIDLGKGKTGYVAAKYINGEILKGKLKKSPIKEPSEKETKKTEEKVDLSTVSDYKKTPSSKTVTGVGAPEYTGGETIVDGKKLNEFNTEIKKLQNKPKIKLILNFSKIWLDGARKAAGEQWSLMGLRDDKQQIEKAILNVSTELQNLANDLSLSNSDRDKVIDKIFNEMLRIENNEEDIIDNIEEIKSEFSGVNENNYESKLAKILELSAGGFKDGNTEKAKEISRDIIIGKYFESLDVKLKPIQSLGDITYNKFGNLKLDDGTEIKLTIGEFNDIKEEIDEIYSETKIANERNKQKIKEGIKAKQPHLTNVELDTLFDVVNKASALVQAKQFFIYKYTEVAKDKINNSSDEILKAYQDLDGNIQYLSDLAGDNGAMIALSLVPMGGGLALAGLIGKIGTRVAGSLSKLKGLGKLGKIPGSHLGTFAKGAVFYEGMNITNNALYLEEWPGLKELVTKNHDVAELVKTALFFNVMKIANNFFPVGEKFFSIQALKNFSTQVFGMTGIDLGGELYKNGGDIHKTFTKEQILNSIITGIMYATMDKVTNIKRKPKKIIEEPIKPGTKPDNEAIKLGNNKSKPHDYKWTDKKPGTKVETKNSIPKKYETVYEYKTVDKLHIKETGLLRGSSRFEGSLKKVGDKVTLKDGIIVEKTSTSGNYKIENGTKKVKFDSYKELENYLIKTRKESGRKDLLRKAPEKVKGQKEIIEKPKKYETVYEYKTVDKLHIKETGLLRGSSKFEGSLKKVGDKVTLKDGIIVEKTSTSGNYKIENGTKKVKFDSYKELENYLIKTRQKSGRKDLLRKANKAINEKINKFAGKDENILYKEAEALKIDIPRLKKQIKDNKSSYDGKKMTKNELIIAKKSLKEKESLYSEYIEHIKHYFS